MRIGPDLQDRQDAFGAKGYGPLPPQPHQIDAALSIGIVQRKELHDCLRIQFPQFHCLPNFVLNQMLEYRLAVAGAEVFEFRRVILLII